MAVSIANLTSGLDVDGGSTSTTASVTPSANKLQLLTINSRTAITADPNQPTITGNGLTWVAVNSVVYDTTGLTRKRVSLFRAMGVAPTAGTIGIDFGGQNQTHVVWSLDEASGVDTSGANGAGAVVQSVTASDGNSTAVSLTATLAAFGSTANATFGGFGFGNGQGGKNVGSGFTLLADLSADGTTNEIFTEWKSTNDTTVDATADAGKNGEIGAVAIEIRAEVIMFDAASNSGYQATASSYNWAHVTSTGNNRYLIVGVSLLSVAGSSVTSITYNSVAMTFLGAIASVTGAVRSELWGIVAPATGSNNIAVTLSAGLISAACAISFTGVHQTSPVEGFNSASATNVGAADATVGVVTVATNDWVVDQVATDDTAITVGAGQTSRNNVTGAGGSGADSTEPATSPATVTMSWTNVGALATWSTVAIALRDINASTLGSVMGFMTTNTKFWGS